MFRFLILLIIFTGLQQLHAQQFQRSSGKKKQQSQECGLMIVDLNNGTVHGLNPVSSIEDIKSKLPCFTSEIEEGSDERCGGGIFYENRSIDFFTGLDCISIRTKFGGTITYKRRPVQLLGATSAQVSEIIKKKPEMVKPAGKKDMQSAIYRMSYGVLVINYLFDHVMEIHICNQKLSALKLCE